MIKIFEGKDISKLDSLTVVEQKISSYDLMKRAAGKLFYELIKNIEREKKIVLIAGPGNNGGDALVLALMLMKIGCQCEIHLVNYQKRILSLDCTSALLDLKKEGVNVEEENVFIPWNITKDDCIVDGIFGVGLNRELQDEYKKCVDYINSIGCQIHSIDIPSGLFFNANVMQIKNKSAIRADFTYSFQQHKIPFFLSDNESNIGELRIIDIGLSAKGIQETETNYFLIEASDVHVKSRRKFSHKGSFGMGALFAGKKGMAGAAILASRAALRSGLGLLTVHVPSSLCDIMQVSIPEAILELDDNASVCSQISQQNKVLAFGIGPGLGTAAESEKALCDFIERGTGKPCVFDADALNILSLNKYLLDKLPANSILTPHPKEFDRMFGDSLSAAERLTKQIEMSKKLGIYIILKGAYTSICSPSGKVYFNSTGNPGMATAGSGDVLTGIILSLLAQGYTPDEASIYGVYIHGLAGDYASEKYGEDSMIASDIIDNIGFAIKSIKNNQSQLK